MKAMILAAGRGSRLRPLTDTCPKPLIKVAGKSLIEYHLENLHDAGITDIVINLRHLGQQIQDYVGNGQSWGVNVAYSFESLELEVGGGIFQALSLLGEDPFIIVNGDIWTDYPIASLPHYPNAFAYLVLVDNPAHNLRGDYSLNQAGYLSREPVSQTYTYSGISVLHPNLFLGCEKDTAFRLAPLLDKAALTHKLMGEYYGGEWTDVGTIDRLITLEKKLAVIPSKKMSS
jgi:MurNAc alpha-1-phosphate uridylyltransferase